MFFIPVTKKLNKVYIECCSIESLEASSSCGEVTMHLELNLDSYQIKELGKEVKKWN